MAEQIDLSGELTTEFFKNRQFKKGSVLIFQDDKGQNTELKIVRLNRSKKICIAEPARLYTGEELKSLSEEETLELVENG